MKPADFATCFADPDTGEPILNAATRIHLFDTAEMLEDYAAEDLRGVAAMMIRDPKLDIWEHLNWLRDYLPPMYAASYDYHFLRDFHITLVTVIYKLGGPWTGLSTVLEQLAMRAILRAAENEAAVKADEGEDVSDIDVSDLWDIAFDDTDFFILFEPELDGLQHSEVGRQMGMINLDRREWFNQQDWAITPPHPLTWRRITATSVDGED